jgi:hypothetical protein
MPLPAKFSGVSYYLILGEYSYLGELVIIPQTLYFFPELDLVAGRMGGDFTNESSRGEAKAIFRFIVNLFRGSYLERNGLWRKGIGAEEFREKADAFIGAAEEDGPTSSFSTSLPPPTRIQAGEVTEIHAGSLGSLSLTARSDRHDFLVGWLARKKLRTALAEDGFDIGEKGF